MASRQCGIFSPCHPCADDDPVANFSAEDPDPIQFQALAFFAGDPPLNSPDSFWAIPASVAPCESVVSQQDARDCATRTVRSKVWDSWVPDGTHGVPVRQFFNAEQSCQLECPAGDDPFIYTIPAGTVVALSQAEADEFAASLCLSRARLFKVCKPSPPVVPTPFGWWRMEEAGAANRIDVVHGLILDASSGTFSGPPGKVGNGIRITSPTLFTDGGLNFNTFVPNVSFTSNFTFWARWDAWTPVSSFFIISLGFYTAGPAFLGGILLNWQLPTGLELILLDSTSTPIVDEFVPFLPVAGQWYFFNFSYDVSTGKLKLQINNGSTFTTVGSLILTGALAQCLFQPFGVQHTGAVPGVITNLMDELAVFTEILTPESVTTIYNNGNGKTWPIT